MVQYNELWLALDLIAERIRAVGHFAPGASGEMLEHATIKPDIGVPEAADMVKHLAAGHGGRKQGRKGRHQGGREAQ